MDKSKREKVWDKTGGYCYYCGKKLDPNNWEIDHKIPKSRGGTDALDNLVPCCPECNDEKGDMTDREYIQYRKNRESSSKSRW